MKKLLSVTFTVALLAAIVLFPAAGRSYAAESDITYSINGATMYIHGTGAMEDYASSDDVPWVNKRGPSAGITKIIVEEGITHIGNHALSRFSAVESVAIPATVESIGKSAFELDTALKRISLPANVKTIGERAFMDCISLTSVTTQGLQGAVPGNAFSGCTRLKTVTLNEGITSVEKYAFVNSDALTAVTLPASVKRVEPDAFDGDVVVSCKDPQMVQFGRNAYRYLQAVNYDVYQNYDYAYAVLELVNKEREAQGLAPLTLDPSLMDSAMERAGELPMLFSHTRPNSGKCGTVNPLLCGENAAAGQNTPQYVVDSWMSSYGHRRNILMSSWKTLGVGCIEYEGCYYWVQCFGMEHSGRSQNQQANRTATQTTYFSVEPFQYENIMKEMVEVTLQPEISVNTVKMNKGTSQAALVCITSTDGAGDLVKAKNIGITWSSSNTDVVTVSSDGILRAVSPGKATITAAMSHFTLEKTITVSCGDAHRYVQTSVSPASYEETGSIKYQCSVCGQKKTSTIYKIKSTKLAYKTVSYNGKVKKPSVKVTDSKGNTIPSGYYTVTYDKGCKKVGTYQVTVVFNDRYEGTAGLSFKINPPKTAITNVNGKKKAFQVKWKKKTTQVSGYQVRYSTSSTFKTKYTKTVTVKGYSKTSRTIKGLKAGKKYYVKVRTYKNVDGKTYYSAWSAKKSVKTT